MEIGEKLTRGNEGEKMHVKQTVRQGNYDLLRIIAMIAVIVLHINAHYFSEAQTDSMRNIESVINILTRFSVPCFVMISGAFLLSKPENKDYISFYKKSFKNIFLPFGIILICLASISFCKAVVQNGNPFSVFYSIAIGDFYNLWYMFMLIGLYLLVPIIILVKESLPNKAYCIISCVWLVLSIWFQYNSSYKISYSFGVVFAYVGYFLIGNVIYENCRKNTLSWLYFLLAIIFFAITTVVRLFYGENRYSFDPYTSFFSLTICIASVFVFLAFSNISIKKSFGELPKLTFYIYLFHTVVYQTIFILLRDKVIGNELVMIVLVGFATLVISYLFAFMFNRIWKKILNRINQKG